MTEDEMAPDVDWVHPKDAPDLDAHRLQVQQYMSVGSLGDTALVDNEPIPYRPNRADRRKAARNKRR